MANTRLLVKVRGDGSSYTLQANVLVSCYERGTFSGFEFPVRKCTE